MCSCQTSPQECFDKSEGLPNESISMFACLVLASLNYLVNKGKLRIPHLLVGTPTQAIGAHLLIPASFCGNLKLNNFIFKVFLQFHCNAWYYSLQNQSVHECIYTPKMYKSRTFIQLVTSNE